MPQIYIEEVIIIAVQFEKTGIVRADGAGVNPNLCTWNYSRNPNFPNTAGDTILSVTVNPDYTRYTATTAGSTGGKYGYPGNDSLVTGNVYTWSLEARASKAITFSRGRMGFEGGGMISGTNVSIGTNWTKITATFTQTSSKAFVFYPCGDLANGEWVDIRNLKLENGNVATPWIPNEADPEYVGSSLGFTETDEKPSIGKAGYVQATEFIEW